MLLITGFGEADEPGEVRVRTYLRPSQSIEVSTTQTGLIETIGVKPGVQVAEGDILIKLNSAVIEAQLAQAQAKAAMTGKRRAAEAEYKLAKDRYDLMIRLKGRGSSSSAELGRGLANLQIAQGNLDAVKEEIAFAYLEVDRIKAELEQRLLRSPIDGTVVEVTRDASESVSMRLENEKPYLVRVVDLSQLRAKAHVPYDHVRTLKVDDQLTIQFPLKDGTIDGKVEFISPLVDPSSRTVEIHVLFPNQDRRIPTGVPCDLLIPRGAE